MLFEDTYLSVEKPAEAIYRDRGSKFLTYVYPIRAEAEIKEIISSLKTGHPKANHHCWAMRLSPDRSIFRINDDGEPSGTAGRPILNVLFSKNLTNILVVVVRYFGGTLLGVPGLIHAYKTATELALAEAVIVSDTVKDVYVVKFSYLAMNGIMKLVKEFMLPVLAQQFDNDCSITVAIRKSQVNQVLQKLENIPGVKSSFSYTL